VLTLCPVCGARLPRGLHTCTQCRCSLLDEWGSGVRPPEPPSLQPPGGGGFKPAGPPQPPPGFIGPSGAPASYGPPPKPTSVVVLGGIMIGFAVIGLCLAVVNLLSASMTGAMMKANPEVAQAMKDLPVQGWTVIQALTGILGALVLLPAGVGVCMAKSWGRVLALGWSGYHILMVIPKIVFGMKTAAAVASMMTSTPGGAPPGFQTGVQVGQGIGLFCTVGLGLILPIATLVILLREDVARCFR